MPNPHEISLPTTLSPLLIRHPTGFLDSLGPYITKNAVVMLHHCIQPRLPCITKARITEFAALLHFHTHTLLPASAIAALAFAVNQERTGDLALQSWLGTLVFHSHTILVES